MPTNKLGSGSGSRSGGGNRGGGNRGGSGGSGVEAATGNYFNNQ